jgi:hypothetical protein
MKMKVEVKDKTKLKKAKKKTEIANFESMEHAAGYIRTAIKNSIKAGKLEEGKRQASEKGQQPKGWKNRTLRALKKSIFYKITKHITRTTAMIYAKPLKPGDRVMQMLEVGGSQYVEISRYTDIVDSRKYRRDKTPRWKENHYKSFAEREKTSKNWEKEKQAIKDYYGNIITRKKITRKVRATYTARPFMVPAIIANMSKFPKIWKTYIGKHYR